MYPDDSLTLHTDLYQINMMQVYFDQGIHNKHAVFEVYFRQQPFKNGYAVFAGLEISRDYYILLEVSYGYTNDITYYFTKFKGLLIAIDIYESTKNQKTKYPRKCYRYDTNGQLIAAGIRVSEEESFLYDKKQKLITHRIGDYGYNDKGKRMWKAEEIEF